MQGQGTDLLCIVSPFALCLLLACGESAGRRQLRIDPTKGESRSLFIVVVVSWRCVGYYNLVALHEWHLNNNYSKTHDRKREPKKLVTCTRNVARVSRVVIVVVLLNQALPRIRLVCTFCYFLRFHLFSACSEFELVMRQWKPLTSNNSSLRFGHRHFQDLFPYFCLLGAELLINSWTVIKIFINLE